MLRAVLGRDLQVTLFMALVFPDDLTHDLVVHCGACMFNRKYVLSRGAGRAQGVPMTNYGFLIARLTGCDAAVP